MDSVILVLLHAGYMLFSFIFFASGAVTLITYVKVGRNERANKVWLSKQWLMVLFFAFGVPCAVFAIALWMHGETTAVYVTALITATLGLVLGLKAEERLRYERH